MMTMTVSLETPLGYALISGDENGLSSILVTDKKPTEVSKEIPSFLQKAILQLQEYFKGLRTDFDLQMNPDGTDFQKKVWNKLCTIPYGATCSYQQLANELNDPKLIRAVANANAKNPLWIVIPCHRVIGSNGSLTGYAGGLHRKKWLLDHEQKVQQLSLF